MFQYRCVLLLTFLICLPNQSKSDTHVLYDTKTSTSDLHWTLHPPYSGWEELSNLDTDGTTIRAYQICNVGMQNQDNWARSPFIDAKHAKRVYIDIEYSVMKCPECRETFTLYYYPSSTNVASSTFPPWRENPYIKLDTIAASERFESYSVGPDGINKKTLVIGQLERRGFYVAAQDQGACMSLMSLKLYYHYCPEVTQNLTFFPKTSAGGMAASLVSVNGTCVPNAVTANNEEPKYRCNSNGEWTVPTGYCQCSVGYEANSSLNSCAACPVGFYKSSTGNHGCMKCPSQSRTDKEGSFRCECEHGYYRAETDSMQQGCTRTPSKPSNLTYVLNETTVRLMWSTPRSTGFREDLYYSITCKECDEDFEKCTVCSRKVNYLPHHHHHVTDMSSVISQLEPYSNYIFKVTSHNGVSSVSPKPAAFDEIRVLMRNVLPPKVSQITLVKKDHQSFTLQWPAVAMQVGRVIKYDVAVLWMNDDVMQPIEMPTMQAFDVNITITDLNPNTEYRVRVRAWSSAGHGHFSDVIIVKTDPVGSENQSPLRMDKNNTMVIAGCVAGGVAMAFILLLVILIRRKRIRKNKEKRIRSKIPDHPHHPLLGKDGFTNTLGGASNRKTYVDYRDPQQGVREVACEIDQFRITIERVIGQGEFGEVCLGKLKEGKKSFPVAVKRLRHEASLMDQTNFLREACTMAQFSHPNIVQFRGVVTKSIPVMIITEFMENGSLDQFLQEKQGELSVLQLLKMLQGIASGMNYLSNMKYVHRDLAARNILVDSELVCKVSDFGLSRTLDNNPHATYTTQGGKIALRWTAPECIRYHRFTAASDVWSYGIVMWEVMSYGEKPYWEMSNDDVAQTIEDGYRLPPPTTCPQALHNLMLECWYYDEKRRPRFQDILQKLGAFLLNPKTLTEDVEMIDISAPLLNPSSPTSLQDVSNLDEWLDMVRLGRYRGSFHAQGINSLHSLSNVSSSDLERLGITLPDHLIRFQNGLDSLRRYISNDQLVELTPAVNSQGFPSEISAITSLSTDASLLAPQNEPLLTDAALV